MSVRDPAAKRAPVVGCSARVTAPPCGLAMLWTLLELALTVKAISDVTMPPRPSAPVRSNHRGSSGRYFGVLPLGYTTTGGGLLLRRAAGADRRRLASMTAATSPIGEPAPRVSRTAASRAQS